MISGVPREVDETCAFLGYYTAYGGIISNRRFGTCLPRNAGKELTPDAA
jgi:hypothetical protein